MPQAPIGAIPRLPFYSRPLPQGRPHPPQCASLGGADGAH